MTSGPQRRIHAKFLMKITRHQLWSLRIVTRAGWRNGKGRTVREMRRDDAPFSPSHTFVLYPRSKESTRFAVDAFYLLLLFSMYGMHKKHRMCKFLITQFQEKTSPRMRSKRLVGAQLEKADPPCAHHALDSLLP